MFYLAAVKLYVNETVSIPFTVINAGSVDINVVVKIEDDQMFSLDPTIRAHPVAIGANVTGTFVIKAGSVVGLTA